MRLFEAILEANHRALAGDSRAGLHPSDYPDALPVVALTCIERCAALGYTEFNAAIGESQTLGAWLKANALADWLIGLPHAANSGDVYARVPASMALAEQEERYEIARQRDKGWKLVTRLETGEGVFVRDDDVVGLHIQLPTALYKRLDTECERRETTKRQLVTMALERYLQETS